jgi:hypothetical protein
MATSPRNHRSASAVARDVIAELAQQPSSPTLLAVRVAVRRHVPDRTSNPSQVLAQRVSSLVATYLRLAPRPAGSTFRPTTLASGSRGLLAWQDQHGRVTVDLVVMTPSPRPATVAAARDELVEEAAQVLGHDLAAVRVIDVFQRTVEVHAVGWRDAA